MDRRLSFFHFRIDGKPHVVTWHIEREENSPGIRLTKRCVVVPPIEERPNEISCVSDFRQLPVGTSR
jgi:hypothetical protein